MKYLLLPLLLWFTGKVMAQPPELVIPKGHSGEVTYVKFSGDGNKIVTTASDGTAKIWSANTGGLLFDLKQHTGQVYCADFSPDGSKIATASSDKSVKIWDGYTGRFIKTIFKSLLPATCVRFSPNGKMVMVLTGAGNVNSFDELSLLGNNALEYLKSFSHVSIVDPDDGKIVMAIPQRIFNISVPEFSKDSRSLIIDSPDSTVQLWDIMQAKKRYTLGGFRSPVYSVKFTTNGSQIIAATRDGDIKVWDTGGHELYSTSFIDSGVITTSFLCQKQNGILAASLSGNVNVLPLNNTDKPVSLSDSGYPLFSAQLCLDSLFLLTADFGGDVTCWDLTQKKVEYKKSGNVAFMYTPAVNSVNTNAVIIKDNSDVEVFDLKTGKRKLILGSPSQAVHFADFYEKNNSILAGSWDHSAKIFNLTDGNLARVLSGHQEVLYYAAIDHTGTKIITASWDSTVKIWDAGTGKCIRTVEADSRVNSVQLSSDEKKIIAACWDNSLVVWDRETGEKIKELTGHKGVVHSAFFNRTTDKIISASDDGFVYIWSWPLGRVLKRKDFVGYVNWAEYSPDGSKVVVALEHDVAEVWNSPLTQKICSLRGHKGEVNFATFSSDGRFIATSSEDGTARIFESATGKCIHLLKGHENAVYSARFSKDSKKIITASEDHTAKVWSIETGQLLYTVAFLDSSDYIILNSDGYYKATPGAARALAWKLKDEYFEFDQWDYQFNRPDIVLKSIGSENDLLISTYKRAWKKRMDKLGLADPSFDRSNHLPAISIVNQTELNETNQTDHITLLLSAKDLKKGNFITAVHISVNNVPVYGIRGLNIADLKLQQLEMKPELKLSANRNVIKVYCLNNHAQRSLLKSTTVYNRNFK